MHAVVRPTKRFISSRLHDHLTRSMAQKYVLAKRFVNAPLETDLSIVQEVLPPIKDGEFLAEALFLSVDPYMRAYAHNMKTGDTMVGTQIARITDSKNKNFPIGKYVLGRFGWRTHTISTSADTGKKGPLEVAPTLLPNFGQLSLSLGLGVLGMPGLTAYFGFLGVCKPRTGETVVVTGAAGAVGSHVGQIAKIKGCRVIGVTGSDTKGRYLVEELGFDGYINYKTENVDERLTELAPEGVDCYFDNVAGEISCTIIRHMNKDGRISVCGSISTYNIDYVNDPPKVTVLQPFILANQLRMQGFQSYLYQDRMDEAIKQNYEWIQQGKIKHPETVTHGFENMARAFIEMLRGENLGKAIIAV